MAIPIIPGQVWQTNVNDFACCDCKNNTIEILSVDASCAIVKCCKCDVQDPFTLGGLQKYFVCVSQDLTSNNKPSISKSNGRHLCCCEKYQVINFGCKCGGR